MTKTRFSRFVSMVLALVMALSFNVFAAADKITFIVTGDTIHGDGGHTAYQEWINTTYDVTGEDAGKILQNVLTNNGYTYDYSVGQYGGYLSSITTPAGDTLAAYTNGSKSGWMTKLNGEMAASSIDQIVPSAGDTVEVFYVDDYEAEIYGYYSTINVNPDTATLEVKNSAGDVIEPSWGSYSFFNGNYTYKASADGYVTKTGDFTVSGAGVTIDIVLDKDNSSDLTTEATTDNTDTNVEWGLFRKDATGTPVVKAQTPTPDNVEVKWATQVKTGWSAMAGSVIANNCIYTAESSNVLKIDKTTGEILAKGTLDSAIGYTYFISYGDGKIFVQLGKGQVEALNADDLTKVWTSEMPNGDTNGQGLTPIYYNNGRVYAGSVVTGKTGSGYYYCLNAETGENIWTITGEKGSYNGFYWSGATAVGDYIVFGCEGGTLRVVDEKGNVVDSYNVSADIRAGVTYSNGKIYFTDKTGYIHSMDITDGKLSNHKSVLINESANASTSTPAVYNGKVYVCAGGKYPSGYFSVFDTDLNQIYTYKTAYNAQSSPLIGDNNGVINVYFTLNGPNGDLLVYDGTDCKTLIDLSAYKNYCIHSPIADSNGTIYYQNDSGYIVAIGSKVVETTTEATTETTTVATTEATTVATTETTTEATTVATTETTTEATTVATTVATTEATTVATTETTTVVTTVATTETTTEATTVATTEAPTETTTIHNGGNSEDVNIRVDFSLVGTDYTWLSESNVELAPNATVADLLSKVFINNGVTAVGIDNGYISSVTYNGQTLAEFDKGPNSGWMYRVNGDIPNVGINSFILSDGDVVSFFYTTDYTKEDYNGGNSDWDDDNNSSSGGSSGGSGSSKVTTTTTTTTEATTEATTEDKTDNNTQDNNNNSQTTTDSTTNVFADVPISHWANKAVNWLSKKGVISGKASNKFAPSDNVTRAEFVAMLYRASGAKNEGNCQFKDVSKDSWYYDAIAWAYNNGIVYGVDNDNFAPNATITRQDMACMAARYANKLNVSLDKSVDYKAFVDEANISAYALDSVKTLFEANIVKGNDNNQFRPTDKTTRAEVAVIIYNLIG